MIAVAASHARRARDAALEELRARQRARRRVAAIDEMLEVLELMNLSRERVIDRMVRARLRRLAAEVGVPLPRPVLRARNTVRLHAALLDWQDIILDVVAPWRRLLLDDDELDVTA